MRRSLAILFVATAAIAAAAPKTPVVPSPSWGTEVIELPRFEVTDTRLLPPPESWHYAEIPGFEILSNISERETRRFTKEFLLLQSVIRAIMPALTRGHSDVPTTLLLCGGGRGYSAFLPADRRDDEFRANSLFFENKDRTAIVIDFALTELDLEPGTRIEADPYRSFYREYFRFLVRRQLGRNVAPWLEEGLVQLFAAVDFDTRWISFGLVGDGFGGSKPGDFNQLLARRWLMPFDEMFAHDQRQTDPLWAAQCYAFVHLCLYGAGKHYQKPFIEFVSRLGTEPPTEKLFQECFHRSYRQMAVELRGYLQYTAFTYVEYKTKKGQRLPEPPPVTLRDATDAEVGRLKGEVLRLGGHDDEAHLALIAPYIRGERDPRLLAALGLDELSAAHEERARKFLEAAARAGAVRARAYLELARLRYAEVLRHAASPSAAAGAGLSREQIAFVLTPLLTARAQPPPLPEVYALMTEVLTRAAEPPTTEQLQAVLEGVHLFPRDADLLAAAVSLTLRSGRMDVARSLVDRGLALFAKQPREVERLQALAAPLAPSAAPTDAANAVRVVPER